MNKRQAGALISIESPNIELKMRHAALIRRQLLSQGYDVEYIETPDFGKDSSYFIRQFLATNDGKSELSPYVAALMYALERYDHMDRIQAALNAQKIVLVSSYTGATMASYGQGIGSDEERRGFYLWLDVIEFQMLQLPRPSINLVLDDTTDIKKRYRKSAPSTSNPYDELTRLFPKDFVRVETQRRGVPVSDTQLQKIIFEKIHPHLPSKSSGTREEQIASEVIERENPYVYKDKDGRKQVTEKGWEFLNSAVTNAKGQVYAFSDFLGQATVAAAMARLSRSSDDARMLILNEFAHKEGQDANLLERVITQYGDDSVQQLVGLHLVVEGASNLLTKELEWGRLAAYLEQSTRYIYFDEKDEQGNYKFYVPEVLDEATSERYRRDMTELFDSYSLLVCQMVEHIQHTSSTATEDRDVAWRTAVKAQACDAVRMVLPVATKSTVGIFGSGQAIEAAIMRLAASENHEARCIAELLLSEARKVAPSFLKRADLPERGGATTAYTANNRNATRQLAEEILPSTYEVPTDDVQLIDYWPKNELDLAAYVLYDQTDASLQSIRSYLNAQPVEVKRKVLETYTGERLNRRHKPGRAFEHAHYTWDLVCDYGIFRDLQRHRMVDDLRWQQLSPRLGFVIPQEVEDAGLTELYERCFDLSAELYSYLQSQGYHYEAQYATLLGHKMRWTVTYNAREAFHLHELRTSPQGHPHYRDLVLKMHEALCEVHPIVGSSMTFVNQDESPELTRLAAEKAAEHKRSLLDNKEGK